MTTTEGDTSSSCSTRTPRRRSELQAARRTGLLRRPDLPPRHQGLHDPGRLPAGHGHRRPRLPVRGRDQRAQDRARRAGHGQRRPEHQRLAVLHRHARRGAVAGRQAHRVRRGHARAWTSSTARGRRRPTPATAPRTRSASPRSSSPPRTRPAARLDHFQAIVLGIVQGLTEFLPISSSGHLRIVPAFAGWEDPGAAFTAVIQLGTMAAVVALLLARPRAHRPGVAGEPARSARAAHELDARMGWYIILGTVPICDRRSGLRRRDRDRARDLYLIGSTLIVAGAAAARRRAGRRARAATARASPVVTRWSSAARRRWRSCPACRARGRRSPPGSSSAWTGVAAARFSFLLSIPAVVLSGLFELPDVSGGDAERQPASASTIDRHVLAFVSRLRVDRLPAALSHHAHHRGVRLLPRRARRGGASRSWRRARSRRRSDTTSRPEGEQRWRLSRASPAQTTNGQGAGAQIEVENPATGQSRRPRPRPRRRAGRRAGAPRARRAARLGGVGLRRPRARAAPHAEVAARQLRARHRHDHLRDRQGRRGRSRWRSPTAAAPSASGPRTPRRYLADEKVGPARSSSRARS